MVMGKCLVGQWIVGVISFQKIFGLYGLERHIVEKRWGATLVDNGNVKIELEFWNRIRNMLSLDPNQCISAACFTTGGTGGNRKCKFPFTWGGEEPSNYWMKE